MRRSLAIGLLLVVAACGQSDENAVTTTLPAVTTSVAAAPTTTSADPAPATTIGAESDPDVAPDFQIVDRAATDEGDRLVVLLEPGQYTDSDIVSVIGTIVEDLAPVEIHLVDDVNAVPLVLLEPAELLDADKELLADHYFARLEDGTQVTFLGPFESLGQFFLGS